MGDGLTMMTSQLHCLTELKGIRAIAVIAVVLFSTSTPGFAAGYLGVDVFFVISGFLVTSLLLTEVKRHPSSCTFDLSAFYSRRVRRLLPAATAVLLCTAVAYRLAVDPPSCVRSRWSFLSAAYYLANWYLIATDTVERSSTSPVQHYWALSVEQQFYFVFPLLFMGLLWAQKRRKGAALSILLFACISLCLLSLALAVWLFHVDEATASMMTAARVYQLLGGSILAIVAPLFVLPPFVSTVSILGMLAALLSSGKLSPLLGGLLASITAVLLIFGLERMPQEARDQSWTKSFLSLSPLTFVGEHSYSIYLVHYPFVVIGDAMDLLPSGALQLSRAVVTLSSSLALAWLLRNLVEIPFHGILLNTSHRKYGAMLWIIAIPLLVTPPLMTVLTPSTLSADFIEKSSHGSSGGVDHDTESYVAHDTESHVANGGAGVGDHVGNWEEHVSAARFVTIGDSHCTVSTRMMKGMFANHDLNGRDFCRSSFPVTHYPNYKQTDAEFLDTIVGSLLDEHTDYLVVWNAKIQYACLYMGKSCGFDSSLNEAVDEVRDKYEPGAIEFFAHVLPFVHKAVLVMLPEPIAPFDPRECLSENPFAADCDWDVRHMPGYEEAVSAYRAVAEASSANGGPEVLLFNTDGLLCPNGRCQAVEHGSHLFRSTNHVDPNAWLRLLPQVEQVWQEAGVSFAPEWKDLAVERAESELIRRSMELKKEVTHAILGDFNEEFTEIMAEYYLDLLPYMQRDTLPTHEEYVLFARQFKQNRERAAAIRPHFRHISSAIITTGTQLVRTGSNQRSDLRESISIPIDIVEEELSWTLLHNFVPPDGPPRWPHLSESGCTEANVFCLSKPWLSLAIALESDLVCLWEVDDGWAGDYERLLEYDVLIILDYDGDDIKTVLTILDEAHFQGSIYFMPSESKNLSFGAKISNFNVPGACSVILDNYWSIKDGVKANANFYPLWFKYPLDDWQQLNTNPGDDPWYRTEAFVARLTGRRSENEEYIEERREAASFLSEAGYSVNHETERQPWGEYYGYFGRCKYAFLPFVKRNSTGQIIADALVSSNFTTLPFSYGHKLWMRVLPPFLTISSVKEFKEKVEYLDNNEEEYRNILADIQENAPAFADERLGETAAEMVAALAVAPAVTFPGVDFTDCLHLPSLSIPQ